MGTLLDTQRLLAKFYRCYIFATELAHNNLRLLYSILDIFLKKIKKQIIDWFSNESFWQVEWK